MTEDRISLDKLSRISEDVTWEQFEAMPDGVLALIDRAQTMIPSEEEIDTRPWVFVMRVGAHLGQPTQAIMSCGHFIKMRRDDRWSTYLQYLCPLDPSNPDVCLFTTPNWQGGPGAHQSIVAIRTWRPHYPQYGTVGAAWAHVNYPTGITNINPNYPNYSAPYAQPNLPTGLGNMTTPTIATNTPWYKNLFGTP